MPLAVKLRDGKTLEASSMGSERPAWAQPPRVVMMMTMVLIVTYCWGLNDDPYDGPILIIWLQYRTPKVYLEMILAYLPRPPSLCPPCMCIYLYMHIETERST